MALRTNGLPLLHLEGRCSQPPGAVLRRRAVLPRRLLPRFGRLCWPLLALSLLACAGGGSGLSDRYPEKKRPDAPRSASDDEVLGAQRQDPADTLEGSLTNEHAAPRAPHAEEPAEAAHERLEYEECVAANDAATKAAATPGAEARKKPVCPPPDSKE